MLNGIAINLWRGRQPVLERPRDRTSTCGDQFRKGLSAIRALFRRNAQSPPVVALLPRGRAAVVVWF
jgi:hypothetical protein